jgi:lysylphosphatidylglycerol synthetase-like protein (DUF2156 family)
VVAILCAAAALVVWFLACALSAGLLTLLSLMAATVLENYAGVRESRTYPIWIFALSLCPLPAFAAGWVAAGLLLPEALYPAVRWGQLAAGALFAPLAAAAFLRFGDPKDRPAEATTLCGSLLSDAGGCLALLFAWPGVAELMRSIGGG